MHRAAIGMVESARAGCIVNISSIGAGRAHRTFAAYDAAKAGVEALTRGAALDLAPFRIRVNAVAPGAIEVERSTESPDHARAQRAAPIPLGRVGRCSDVAAAVAFLCSDDAAYITGHVLTVDGGMSAQLLPPQLDFPMPPSVVERLAGRLR
jgi:NAD(P)-dependent dehydrogenase (short-subunit alcohol dehydrogenase family)